MKKPRAYIAVGYSFINDNIYCGYVGDVHSLTTWILILFGEKGAEYFKGYTDKEIIKYIKHNAGYRLEVFDEK